MGPKNDISIQIDNSTYQADVELGDGLIFTFGLEVNNLLHSDFITKQEENNII